MAVQSQPNVVSGPPAVEERNPWRPWLLLASLVIGYIGIYLCRKNFAVANPLIRKAFHLNREQIGIVASYSTVAYMLGKFVFGPITDRIGGRIAFLMSLLAVCIFGALGGLVGSLPLLTFVYSLNRFAGAAGWGGMLKQVPDWFPSRALPFAIGILSLGFVFGGVCATHLAGKIANWSGDNWRWVMSGPSLVLAVILCLCWLTLSRLSSSRSDAPKKSNEGGWQLYRLREIACLRQFWIVLALSFTLNLLRETFNTWTVDFFTTSGGAHVSTQNAAFLSMPFDGCGAAGIVFMGWVFGRIGTFTRMCILFGFLVAVALLIYLLPALGTRNLILAAVSVGAIGFLAYGPYSLLAGLFAVEIKGKEYAGTLAGIFDGVGYLAAILSGQQFGRLLDTGGYRLGFNCLAGLAAISAVLCLFLYSWFPNKEAARAMASRTA